MEQSIHTLTLLQKETLIHQIKDEFEQSLKEALSLTRISSPIAVMDGTGINDDLNGTERPVGFPVKAQGDSAAVVVHSLAKWKRMRLAHLNIEENHGIITDMRALRPDEDETPIHSVYVDQWDWEKRISPTDRSVSSLQTTVKAIYASIKGIEQHLAKQFVDYAVSLPNDITFIHAEELLQQYPSLSPKQRETAAAKKHGAIFLMGIGGRLSNGEPHDGRAPDYDDWSSQNELGSTGLNGDIIVWNELLQSAFELSSMGIRVNRDSLKAQLKESNTEERSTLQFHQLLLNDKLPQSIGGGIGQSRLVMFLLRKQHIGEVQVGLWSNTTRTQLANEGIELL